MKTVKCKCGRMSVICAEGVTMTVSCTWCQSEPPPPRPPLRLVK